MTLTLPLTPPLTPRGHLTQGMTAAALAGLLLVACQPTVRVEAPQEPITINLNIKLDADVRLKIEEHAEETIESNPELF